MDNPTLPEVPKPDMVFTSDLKNAPNRATIIVARPFSKDFEIIGYIPAPTFGRKPRTLRHDTLDNRGK